MNRHRLKVALRTLRKQRFYTSLNVFGLSLGIAAGIVLFQFIRFHLSFDKYHPQVDQLYKLATELHLPDGSVIYESGSPLPMSKALKQTLPQVTGETVLLTLRAATVSIPGDGVSKHFAEHNNIAFADEHWFKLFHYTQLEGNTAQSLLQPNTAFITRKLAEKYFGTTHATGRRLLLDNKFPITVTGVLENNPENTDIRFDMFISNASFRSFYPQLEADMQRDWNYINYTTQSFITVPANAVPQVEATMATLVKQHFDTSIASAFQFHLLPLKTLHFDNRYGGTIRKSMLTTLAITGAFLVVIACFNFINMASAQSVKRAKEIGTRKVLGSTPAAIFWQFITELSCVVLGALLLSFVWIIASKQLINDWLQLTLNINPFNDRVLLLAIVILLVFVILTSGIYPAFILSRFKPIEALKSTTANRGSSRYRKGLVIAQNVIVQGLIICTLVITLQVQHLKNANLGFNKEAVLMVNIPDSSKSKMYYLQQQLLRNPGIQSVSFCYQAPSSDAYTGGSVQFDHRPWEDFSAGIIMGDSAYLHTFGLHLIAGHNLAESDTVNQVLINQAMLQRLGLKQPEQALGHQLVVGGLDNRTATIAGIVKDFNVHSLYTSIAPVLITTHREKYRYAAIRLNNDNGEAAMRENIRNTWQNIYSEHAFEYHYLDEQIDAFYHKEDLLGRLIKTTTLIAIVISCLGLLGLISFVTLQRTREIGVRKVLGASVKDIVYLVSRDFLRLLLLSLLITSPLAYYFMHQWLDDFAYRINISWWIFIAAGILSMLIAFATISFQSIKAAMANPVKSLRMD